MQSKYAFTLAAMIAVIQCIESEGSVRSFLFGPSEHEEMMEKQVTQYNHATEMKRMELESQDKLMEMMRINESAQRHAVDREAEVQLAKENTKKHEASAKVLMAQHVAEQEKSKTIQSSNELEMQKERARVRVEEEKTKQAELRLRQKTEEIQEQLRKERIEKELRLAEQKEKIESEMKMKEAERNHELNLKKIEIERIKIEQKMKEEEQAHEMRKTVIIALATCFATCTIPVLFQIYKHFRTRQHHRANRGDYREPAAPPATPPNAPITEVETDQTTDTSDVDDNTTTATSRERFIAEVGY